MVHAILYAPYVSKERSLEYGTRFFREYASQVGRTGMLFIGMMTYLFGIKQYIYQNKDYIVWYLTKDKVFSKNWAELSVYFGCSLPAGLAINFWHTGRFLRGTFSYSLMFALLVRLSDGNDYK